MAWVVDDACEGTEKSAVNVDGKLYAVNLKKLSKEQIIQPDTYLRRALLHGCCGTSVFKRRLQRWRLR